MFSGLIKIFRKPTEPEGGHSTEVSKDPKPVSEVPLIEGGAGQVDTRVIRLNTLDVARTQTRGTGVGGATLIDPIKF
jgi:hypothetical protein